MEFTTGFWLKIFFTSLHLHITHAHVFASPLYSTKGHAVHTRETTTHSLRKMHSFYQSSVPHPGTGRFGIISTSQFDLSSGILNRRTKYSTRLGRDGTTLPANRHRFLKNPTIVLVEKSSASENGALSQRSLLGAHYTTLTQSAGLFNITVSSSSSSNLALSFFTPILKLIVSLEIATRLSVLCRFQCLELFFNLDPTLFDGCVLTLFHI